MANSFVAIDFETANSFRGSACEIGLVRVVDGVVDATFDSLIRPHAQHEQFDGMNVSIHGIHAGDVAGSPEFSELWPEIADFTGDLPLVAHNASFDMRVLRDLFFLYDLPVPTATYFCTLVLSRRVLNLTSYSLPFVARELGLADFDHHRASADARSAAEVALALVARTNQPDLGVLSASVHVSAGTMDNNSWVSSAHSAPGSASSFSAASITAMREALASGAVVADGPLTGRRVAFTGGLSSMTRAEAAARVLQAGGEPEVGVTKHTDFLVIGAENGYTISPTTATTAKFQKAEALRQKGSAIEVLDELAFIRML
jgi:DNA polymerase III epsilon subunit-like protein